MVNLIKKELSNYFGLYLTDDQINLYLLNNNLETFDTIERSDIINYYALEVTNIYYPLNTDSQEYKDNFYKLAKQNAKKFGYIWKI